MLQLQPRKNQSEESVKVQGRQRGGAVPIWCEQFSWVPSVVCMCVCAALRGAEEMV